MMNSMWKTLVATILLAFSATAQLADTYKIRLAPVAIDAAMKANIAGEGLATATLSGNKLTISGTFSGLKSAATVAHIHQGTVAGVRGARVLDLTVTKDTKGEISGTFDLQPEQVDFVKKGRWYIQIHSEKAPEGNLWGWLMK